MAHTDESGELRPLVQPRLIRVLKNRDRAVDFGFREEVLDELEQTIKERRTSDTVASRISHFVTNAMKDSAEPVVRNRMRSKLEGVNQGALERL